MHCEYERRVRSSLLVASLLLVASCEPRASAVSPSPTTNAPSPVLTWEPSKWLDRDQLFQLADDKVLLREHQRLLVTDTRGALLWQRTVNEVTRITPLVGGTIAITDDSTEIEIVDTATGRGVATHTLPRSPGVGIALARANSAAFHIGRGYAFLRDGAISVVERRSPIDIIPLFGAVDPRGNLWVARHDVAWAALDPSGKRAFELMPEGYEASFSFPPVFTDDAAWMFHWRTGTVGKLVAIDYRCVVASDDIGKPRVGEGVPARCILNETVIPEIERAPLVDGKEDIVAVSHGSVLTDDESQLYQRRIDVYKEGTLLWTRRLPGYGPPLPLEVCGARVAVLSDTSVGDSDVLVFDLQTGSPSLVAGEPTAMALFCLADRFVLVRQASVSTLPATP